MGENKPGVTLSRKCMFLTKMMLYFTGFLACMVALGSFLMFQSKLQKDIIQYQTSYSNATSPVHHCVINFANWFHTNSNDDDDQGTEATCLILYNGTQPTKDIALCDVTLASAASGAVWGFALLVTTIIFFRKKLLRVKSCHIVEKITAVALTIILMTGGSATTDATRKFCSACSDSQRGSCADCGDFLFKAIGKLCMRSADKDFLQGYIKAMQLVEYGLWIGAGAYFLLAVLLFLTRGGLIRQEDPPDKQPTSNTDAGDVDDDTLLMWAKD